MALTYTIWVQSLVTLCEAQGYTLETKNDDGQTDGAMICSVLRLVYKPKN